MEYSWVYFQVRKMYIFDFVRMQMAPNSSKALAIKFRSFMVKKISKDAQVSDVTHGPIV